MWCCLYTSDSWSERPAPYSGFTAYEYGICILRTCRLDNTGPDNVRKGNLTLEIFIKKEAPKRPALPHPEHTGLRHLAFRVTNVEEYLAEFDRLEIPHTELRYDDFDGRKMAFFFDPDGLPLEIHE